MPNTFLTQTKRGDNVSARHQFQFHLDYMRIADFHLVIFFSSNPVTKLIRYVRMSDGGYKVTSVKRGRKD